MEFPFFPIRLFFNEKENVSNRFDKIARKMDLASVEAAAESGRDAKFWRKLWVDK